MMTEAKRTPTPWTLKIEDEGQLGTREYAVFGPDRELLLADTPYYPSAPSEADAEFIVRAVNSHADMLAALKGLLSLTKFDLGGNAQREPWKSAIAKCDAAISKATGEQP